MTTILKLKISESQENVLRPALKALESSMFRFSTPSLVGGTLTIDPFDFAQLITFMQRNFEDDMEIFRFKKQASAELKKRLTRCRKPSSREALRQILEKLEWAKPKPLSKPLLFQSIT